MNKHLLLTAICLAATLTGCADQQTATSDTPPACEICTGTLETTLPGPQTTPLPTN